MIYLLPVQHDLQFGSNSRYTLLQEFIELIINEKGITLACEEASQQDLDHPNNRACVKEVADHHKITHKLCDLTDEERSRAGIFTAQEFFDWKQEHIKEMSKLALQQQDLQMKEKQDKFEADEQSYQRKRERAWFERIKDKKLETILFILGAGHISSHSSSGGGGFDKLLEQEGWSYEILKNEELFT
jgi:predicted mannosyl-3-phosphoglycerate phosphatase (HAD superfamily)